MPMQASQLIDIATQVSPVLATILLSVSASMLLMKKDISHIQTRLDEYDKLNIKASLARIETDISWIRAKLEKKV